jgi:hypothetical protein
MSKMKDEAAMFKSIHAQDDKEESLKEAYAVAEKPKKMRLSRASGVVRRVVEKTLLYATLTRSRTSSPSSQHK